MVRNVTDAEIAPRAEADERDARFPRDLFTTIGRLDLMGLPFDPEVGGSGLPYAVYLRVVEELSRGFLAVGLGLSVHTLATWAVATYASDEVRKEWVPRMTSGE